MTDEDWNTAIERAAKLLDNVSGDCLKCLEVDATKEAETYQRAADMIRMELKRPTTKSNSITINGKKHLVFKTSLTYEELVKLSGNKGQPSMTCSMGLAGRSLYKGQSIDLVPNMRFTVVHTNNA